MEHSALNAPMTDEAKRSLPPGRVTRKDLPPLTRPKTPQVTDALVEILPYTMYKDNSIENKEHCGRERRQSGGT